MPSGVVRVAMWSGPRNISTALMRSWGNRPDTIVIDEPFYAYYLKRTGVAHPGAREVIANGETNWRKIVAQLTGPVPNDARILYQKQMTHHLLPEIDRNWLRQMKNCFLIRDPSEVIISYMKKNDEPTLEDLGFVQQAEIFDYIQRETGSVPPVIDADDVLRDPKRVLRLLCDAIDIEFTETMLSWPRGPRPTDGVWAKYWYTEVENSTSFRPYQPRAKEIPERSRGVYEQCHQYYEKLCQYRLY